MKIIAWLCHTYPAHRTLIITLGYIGIVLMAAMWFLCFPLAAILLLLDPHPMNSLFPFRSSDLQITKQAYLGILSVFTLLGFVMIYFTVRDLRRIRLG